MRLRRIFCITGVLSSLILLPASAQTPDTGLIGVGANFGVFFPDEAFEKTITLDAFGEYYVTPRVSIRGLFGWASPGFENQTENHFRQVKMLVNAVYNWEYGTWHPFVTGGVGAYFVRVLLDNAQDPDSETRGGLNLGGGIEYFLDDRSAVKGEIRWDIVTEPLAGPDASGLNVTFGYKVYF